MEIIWHGHSCFTIKGKDATVVTDPYGEIGLKVPKLKADIVTISHDHASHSNLGAVEGNPQVFDWAGEYEKSGVLMTLIKSFHYPESEKETAGNQGENLMVHFELDGIKIAHMGDLGHKLTDAMIEALGNVDILMIPVGGGTTIDHKKAHEVVEQIDPRVVIPMHYKVDGMTREDLAGIDLFMKEVGTHSEPRDSFKIKSRSELPEETTAFVILSPVAG